MKLKYIFILSFLLGSTIIMGQKENLIVDKIVAKVGGEVVYLSDIEEQYAYMRSQQQTDIDKCEILSNLIAQGLLTNQAKLDSIEVTDQQVNEQLDARLDRILQLMNNDMSQFESYYGKTVAEVREDMRTSIRNQILSDRMRSQVISDVEATPAETVAFFNKMHQDSIPYYNAEVQLNELVFDPIISEAEKNAAIDKLLEIKERVLSGELSFENAAKSYSEDPGTARRGGDLGMMKRGSLVWEFESTAYNLEKGEISEVIESEFGYHLIKLIERRGNNIHTQHILMKPKLTAEDLEHSMTKLDSIKQLILSDQLTFEQAVHNYGNKNVQSYNNGGGMLNPMSGDAFFEIGDLDPDVYFAIDTIQPGELAGPIEFRERDGTIMLHLIQLKTISQPHKASLSTDYAKIKDLATQKKQYDEFKNWIDETSKSTYLSIMSPFEECGSIRKWIYKDEGLLLNE